eukprot:SAG31_NODE_41509_length_275_cov_2.062500_1_plen_57_part_10
MPPPVLASSGSAQRNFAAPNMDEAKAAHVLKAQILAHSDIDEAAIDEDTIEYMAGTL